MSVFGFSLLAQQTAAHLESEWDWRSDDREVGMIGKSKIEQLFFAALEIQCMLKLHEYSGLVVMRPGDILSTLQADAEKDAESLRLIAWPQAGIEGRFVDFLFLARDYRDETFGQWRRLIVECDGHDYHERTKEQAARDRSKDRAAVLKGYENFRFTGSELWRDPWGCALQVGEWAAGGLP